MSNENSPTRFDDQNTFTQDGSFVLGHNRRHSQPRNDRKFQTSSDRRGRAPPWLRGKQIGLWYRDRLRKKMGKGSPNRNEKREKKAQPIKLYLGKEKEDEIRLMLNSIKAEFPYPIQTSIPRPSKWKDVASNINRFAGVLWSNVLQPGLNIAQTFLSTIYNVGLQSTLFLRESVEPQSSRTDPQEWTEVSRKKQSRKSSSPDREPSPSSFANDKYKNIEDSRFKRRFIKSITCSLEDNVKWSLETKSRLKRNARLDLELKTALERKMQSRQYKEMLEFRKKLPAFGKRDEILNLLEQHQVVVISGETGCGKTTQVGQFILDSEIMKGNGSMTYIVCTQPRRISAISVAERVAYERDELVGNGSVGYQIRLEKKLPYNEGAILFCTTGILITRMANDPALQDISHLILDEIHERDTISDFTIAILKYVIPKRPDLRVILMSATLNAERFSKYYSDCPMLHIPGFTFPVKEYYLENVLEMLHYKEKPTISKKKSKFRRYTRQKKEAEKEFHEMIGPYIRQCKADKIFSASTLQYIADPESENIDLNLMLALITYICFNEGEGAVLVFLPGWDKISALNRLIQESRALRRLRLLVIPLHSMLPTITQRSVFDRPPRGVRKIVIATSIAETSITIDDIVFVIDCGKIKMQTYDLENNLSILQEDWISLANGKQRKGRAGRVQEGICYHLITKAREQTLSTYPLPEMLRTRLEEVILQAKMLQVGRVAPFLQKVMDPPDPKAIDLGLKLLSTLNALDEEENLTPLGYHLAKLPLDPQTGKMILMGAIFSCVDPIFSVAASLSFKDAFVVPLEQEELAHAKKRELAGSTKSDHLTVAEAIKRWEYAEERGFGRRFAKEYFLSNETIALLCDMKKQFAQYLFEMKFLRNNSEKDFDANINSENTGLIKAIICSGLYPNVAIVKFVRRTGSGYNIQRIYTPEDGAVKLHIKSVNDRETDFESKFLMYHLKLKSSSIFLHDTTMISPLPLLFFGQKFDLNYEKNKVIIKVSNDICFTCTESTALLIKELRQRMDYFFEQKVCNPGVTNWTLDSDEGILLRAIITLISYEERQLVKLTDSESNEDSDSSSDSDSS